MIRAYVTSICACAVVLASVALQSARASEDLNVSYISKDAVAAVVVHPRRLITSPDLEMLPVELPVALGMDLSDRLAVVRACRWGSHSLMGRLSA